MFTWAGQLCVVALYGGGRGREGTVPLAQLSAVFSHFLHYPQVNWALLVLIPLWVGLCTFWHPVGLSRKLSCEAGSFSCCNSPAPRFSVRGLRLHFPTLEPWVVQSVSLSSCSSKFICTQTWACTVRQPLPCCESSLPICPSLPFLLFWMNVSSLIAWFSDFHTVRFSVSSGCF